MYIPYIHILALNYLQRPQIFIKGVVKKLFDWQCIYIKLGTCSKHQTLCGLITVSLPPDVSLAETSRTLTVVQRWSPGSQREN